MRYMVAAVLLALLVSTAVLAAPSYTLKDCGAGKAYGINNNNEFVGVDSVGQTFVQLTDGTRTSVPQSTLDMADINDDRAVLGTIGDGNAWVWEWGATGVTVISYSEYIYTKARELNNAGQVAGLGVTWFGEHAFVWSPPANVVDLAPYGGFTNVANGINSAGVAVGTIGDEFDTPRMFRWSPALGLKDFGVGRAFDINDSGVVLAWRQAAADTGYACLFTPDAAGVYTRADLPLSATFVPARINNSGVVIGAGVTDAAIPVVSKLGESTWDVNTLLSEGSDPGITVTSLQDINDAGVIAGFGADAEGNSHAILLQPASAPPPPPPPPADTMPPVISGLNVDPATLWPPKNDLRAVNVAYTVTDNQDPAPTARIASITCTQPSFDALSDAVIVNDHQVMVRATRDARAKADRVYTITIEASDVSGNTSTATVNVIVPRSAR